MFLRIRPSPLLAGAIALVAVLAAAPESVAEVSPDLVDSITWSPQNPTVDDVVLLTIRGFWLSEEPVALRRLDRNPDPTRGFWRLYADPAGPVPVTDYWALQLEPLPQPDPGHDITLYEVQVALTDLSAGVHRVGAFIDDPTTIYDPPLDFLGDFKVVELTVGPAAGAARDTLDLHGGRFRATVTWHDYQGNTGQGRLVPGQGAEEPGQPRTSGLFSFFTPDNWEVMVKLLDGCTVNGRYWAFVAAATSVEYTLRIEDVVTGEVWELTNPLGKLSPAVADTAAFGGCASPAAR